MNRKFVFISMLAAASLSYSLVQAETPVAVHLYPQNQQVKAGDKAVWYLTAAGAEPIQYQWKLNGKNVPGAKTNTLRIASAKAADQGIYTCSVTNKFGSLETEPVQLGLLSQGSLSTAQKINSNKVPAGKTVQNTIK